MILLDATNVKANRWEGEVQDFEAKSRQDITKYSSEQVQAGGSVSVTYGSGGGATFNAAYNSAKLNTAQVENQTTIDIGKGGMDVKVKKNAHFEGAVMSSQAEKENNLFQAGTLTTSDIENHSELKTRSAAISGGSGGVNPMSVLSLLGNKNESERSTTKAAIGENIAITLTQDPNAESTLNQLNRDTQNANQKVTKHDISEVKETQELVKGIGEIAEKAYQIYTHSEREKVTEAKLELGKAQAQKASKEEIGKLEANLDRLQKEFDKNYGTGSKTKRAVDAVTAALQGLAAKDVGQAAVRLASPYLNEQIKKYTEGDTQANLIAHALLGAVEAAATGNNVLAGAAAGAGSEAAADFIVKTLYKGKSTKDLSESEKQTVTFLSQLAGGLASGIIGDSTQSAAVGADIGKRAVENNKVNKSQAGTVEGFEGFFNNTRTKMGTLKNKDAEVALFRLNDIGLDLKPATTPPFNNMYDRYIYTEDGGWIDMAHFVFYAGDAYSEKVSLLEQREYLNNINKNVVNKYFPYIPTAYMSNDEINSRAMSNAIKHGYWQEKFDSLYPSAKHSAYSYEDLPSDRLGAEFGAKYFDPDSNLTLGQQVSNYLRKIGVMNPKKAPNYNELPNEDDGSHSGIINKTTSPLFIKKDK